MITLRKTQHGQARSQQRFREGDVELIFSLGLDVSDNEIFMTNKSAKFEIRLRQQKINFLLRTERASHQAYHEIVSLKSEIHQIERIRNRKIVVDGTTLISCYPTTRREQRRCLRLRRKFGFGRKFNRGNHRPC